MTLERWVDEVSEALGITHEVDTGALLDVARVVAHRVERRAAPVTTYLMGLAVASGSGADLAEVARTLVDRARAWRPDDDTKAPTTQVE